MTPWVMKSTGCLFAGETVASLHLLDVLKRVWACLWVILSSAHENEFDYWFLRLTNVPSSAVRSPWLVFYRPVVLKLGCDNDFY